MHRTYEDPRATYRCITVRITPSLVCSAYGHVDVLRHCKRDVSGFCSSDVNEIGIRAYLLPVDQQTWHELRDMLFDLFQSRDTLLASTRTSALVSCDRPRRSKQVVTWAS